MFTQYSSYLYMVKYELDVVDPIENTNGYQPYNYIVRDKLPQIILESGGTCTITKSNDIINDLKSKIKYEIDKYLQGDVIDNDNLFNIIATLYSVHTDLYDLDLESEIESLIERKGTYLKQIILKSYIR